MSGLALAVVLAGAGGALAGGDLPEAERLARLAPHFSPRPGEEVRVDPRELRDAVGRVAAGKLRAHVTVTPPKGACFTITRREDLPDDEVCGKTTLAVPLDELDRSGHVAWRVVTGAGDWGTTVRWPTPYRTAITVPWDAREGAPPVYRFIADCAASVDAAQGRRIALTLLDGARWTIRLPAEDELLPQPPPIPNLQMSGPAGKVSVKEAANPKPPEGEAPAPASTAKAPVIPDEEEDRAVWSIPRRGSYGMNAAAFQPHGSVAGRIKGQCRYTFEGPVEDPGTGRLECHGADGFREIYLPLVCLKGLRKS